MAGLLLALTLGACTIEIGPPPESDPPLVPERAKAAAAPEQPTEPQAWSRDLDFTTGASSIDRKGLTDGLVASDTDVKYSGQRLTYESAFTSERPPTEAELALKRAKERAAAASAVTPPRAVAAPVEEVNEQSLPPIGGEPSVAGSVAEAPAAPEDTPVTEEISEVTPEAKAASLSMANVKPEKAPEVPAAGDGTSGEAAFLAEAWDAPAGTILVQVSAVDEKANVIEEWRRLRGSHPQVLNSLRLVVDEAKLGEREVFYRVQAGAFGSEEGALAACNALIDKGQSCFVVVR